MAIYMPQFQMTTLEWLERKGCKNKRDFLTKASAKAECKRIKKYQGNKLYPYKCKFCDKWHVSMSKPKDE